MLKCSYSDQIFWILIIGNMLTVFFLLMSSMVGIGFMTLSIMCKTSGLLLSILLVFGSGLLAFFGSFQLIRGTCFTFEIQIFGVVVLTN